MTLFEEILSIVLRAVYWVLVPAALLRFQMQAVRAPFRNPVGQFICAVTDWIVLPLRRLLGSKGGRDWASLVAAFLFQLLHGLLFDLLSMRWTILRGGFLPWAVSNAFEFLSSILSLVVFCLLVYAVLSWVRTESVLADILEALVSPLLKPIRRRMPMVGGFDLSPLVLLVVIQIANVLVLGAQSRVMLLLLRP
jgi:YggT family protein